MRKEWLLNLTHCVAKVLKSSALFFYDTTVLSQCWANMFIFHSTKKKQQRWNCVMYRCSWMWVSSHWSILHHPYQACLSFSVSVLMLSTYPSPDPTLTPTLLSIDFCWVRGGGRWAVAQILKLILLLHPPHHQYVPISIYISVYSFFPHSQKRL